MTPTPGERLARLEADMGQLKGFIPRVENLEDKVATFIDRHEAREEERDRTDRRRAKIHFALLGGLITLVVGFGLALLTWILDGKHVVVNSGSLGMLFR